ncbi:MAG: hypothetical protein ACRENX_11290 [Candidatus Dormibacteria bacterium]
MTSTIPARDGTTLIVSPGGDPRLGMGAEGAALVGHSVSRRLAKRRRRHEPGRVLMEMAVTLWDGGQCFTDLATPAAPCSVALGERQIATPTAGSPTTAGKRSINMFRPLPSADSAPALAPRTKADWMTQVASSAA